MISSRKKIPSKIHLITDESRADIDNWVAKYPDDQKCSAVMAALRIVQDQNAGSLTTDIMDAVAEYLEMQPIEVYEVATFYSMYEMNPVGQHKICVCTNISCLLCGSTQVVKHLEQKLGIKMGEVTPDGKFSLKEVECLGACVNAPMCQIGNEYHEKLTPEILDKILDGLK
jgi:NADH-quinone oxidoreductase subunit E